MMTKRKAFAWAFSPLTVLLILYVAFFGSAFYALCQFAVTFCEDCAFLWRNLGPNCMERR